MNIPIKVNTLLVYKSDHKNVNKFRRQNKRLNNSISELEESKKVLISIIEKYRHALHLTDYLEYKRLTK